MSSTHFWSKLYTLRIISSFSSIFHIFNLDIKFFIFESLQFLANTCFQVQPVYIVIILFLFVLVQV
jgi:hypothetical protein